MFEHFLTIFIVPNRWLEQSRTLCTYIVAISCKQAIIATCAAHMALRDLSGAITLSRKIFLAGVPDVHIQIFVCAEFKSEFSHL